MTSDLPEENQEAAEDHYLDWENRILCSDGNCIGIIGADGCCKECGKKYEGELPKPAPSDPDEQGPSDLDEQAPSDLDEQALSDLDQRTETEVEDPSSVVDETEHTPSGPADDEWEHRVLCSDGNCIGVIGSDGKCKECGKPLE